MGKEENKNILFLQFFALVNSCYKPFMSEGGSIELMFNVDLTIRFKKKKLHAALFHYRSSFVQRVEFILIYFEKMR